MLLVFVDAVNQFGITIFHRFDQFRDLFRRALQVVVDSNDIVTFGVIETAESSAVLPEVLGQADDSGNIRAPFLDLFEHFPACVAAAIIHENHLIAFPGLSRKVVSLLNNSSSEASLLNTFTTTENSTSFTGMKLCKVEKRYENGIFEIRNLKLVFSRKFE
jgi:hypothetical protein